MLGVLAVMSDPTRRHGWRVRHLQDLPTQGMPVTLRPG
jgi:transposase